ncbi:MAG TPA: hypothetical protein VHV28_02750 [Solirubrobacteraceae bacterium]|nr:hypothetical protein [Solirubrobacteraceae bacterium]
MDSTDVSGRTSAEVDARPSSPDRRRASRHRRGPCPYAHIGCHAKRARLDGTGPGDLRLGGGRGHHVAGYEDAVAAADRRPVTPGGARVDGEQPTGILLGYANLSEPALVRAAALLGDSVAQRERRTPTSSR